MSELEWLRGWCIRKDPRENGDWEVIIPDGTRCPWYVATVHQGVLDAEAEQVARLIAAAPDLLEALTVAVDWIVDLANSGDAGFWDPEKTPQVIQARAAIAKALGEGQ